MTQMNLPPAAKAAVEQAISSFGNIRHPQYDGTPQTWCAENKRVLNEQTELVLTALAPFMEAPANVPQDTKGEPEAGFRDIINHVIGQLEPLARQLIHPQENVFQKMIVSLQAARDYPLKSAAPSPRACPATEDWMKEAACEALGEHDPNNVEKWKGVEALVAIIARHAPSTEDSRMLKEEVSELYKVAQYYAACTDQSDGGSYARIKLEVLAQQRESASVAAMVRTPKESNE